MKRNTTILLLILLTLLLSPTAMYADSRPTVRQQMEKVKDRYGVKFVYDSSTKLDVPCVGLPSEGASLKSCLSALFKNTGLKWEQKGNYVILLPRKKYTLSGYVYQDDGETAINATVFDNTGKTGTVTNEHGYFSLTLPEGRHTITYSSFGCGDHVEDIVLTANMNKDVTLSGNEELDEVVVTADLNSPLSTTQTGKISLTAKDLNKEFALLSSPDVVKTLQNLSGVAAGTEITSGLYVHGGGNDENLFMLDGTPLYQVNHLGGLFSAFNTDVIKNIDFYKSGFPARYGGRLSSVVDVRTRDGNMEEYHGSFSIGLLDGRVQFEGPIVKNRTSFNVAMRRTWLDLISIPGFAISNHNASNEHINFRYAFHDINAKITHIFSKRSRADISLYSGDDVFSGRDRTDYIKEYNYYEYSRMKLQWGNLTAALNWKYQFSPKLYSVFTGIYTYNRSRQNYYEHDLDYDDKKYVTGITHIESRSRATINDAGCRMEFDYRPNQTHHIRTGSNYLLHFFHPQSYSSRSFSGDSTSLDTITQSGRHFFRGQEFSLYAEDNIAPVEKLRINVGLHYTFFNIPGKTYQSLEPRLAARYQFSDRVTAKLSYTEMSQFMHQLSNSYLNLPMDYWVPSTRKIAPSRSRQYAAGVYLMLPRNIRLNVEGFYKSTRNLIEYEGGNNLTPAFDNWDSHVRTGRGKAYGLELEASWGNKRLSVNSAYTLSWNRRNFPDFHSGWYPDKFDNRHKFNINVQYNLKKGIDCYASWCYHSGNRMTVPQQVVIAPVIPGIGEGTGNETMYMYEQPNNVALPAYHRLDLGINFRKVTKKGHERIWNVSIYNATCRQNPFLAKVKYLPDGSYIGKATSIFPIIPSFSYTLKF